MKEYLKDYFFVGRCLLAWWRFSNDSELKKQIISLNSIAHKPLTFGYKVYTKPNIRICNFQITQTKMKKLFILHIYWANSFSSFFYFSVVYFFFARKAFNNLNAHVWWYCSYTQPRYVLFSLLFCTKTL